MHPFPHSSNPVGGTQSLKLKTQLLALTPATIRLSISNSLSHQVLLLFASKVFSRNPVLFPSKSSTVGYQAELSKLKSDKTLLGFKNKGKAPSPGIQSHPRDGAAACPLTPFTPHLPQHLAVLYPLHHQENLATSPTTGPSS